MNRPRIIIIDDIPSCIHRLQSDLEQYHLFDIVATGGSCAEATDLIIQYCPDIVFLDINLPDQLGLELTDQLALLIKKMHIRIVFYSAFKDYLIDCLRKNAFDFLSKPYLQSELDIVVERLINQPQRSLITQPYGTIDDDRTPSGRCCLQTSRGSTFVRTLDIVYFEFNKEKKVWNVYCDRGIRATLRGKIVAEDILMMCDDFIRINKYCILNINHLSEIENYTYKCLLRQPYEKVSMIASRRCYAKIKEHFKLI